jgi:serine protease AprX
MRGIPRVVGLSGAIAVAAASHSVLADSVSEPPFVRLRYATFDPAVDTPNLPGLLRARAGNELYLVQFVDLSTALGRADVERAGGTIHRFLPDHTHLVRLDASAKQAVEALPGIRWVGEYHPAYRLDPALAAALMLPARSDVPVRYSIEATQAGDQFRIANRVQELGGIVEVLRGSSLRLEATLTRAQLLEILHLNEVNYIDLAGPPGRDMDIVRQLVGAVPLLSSAGFTGQGVRGELMDAALDLAHPAFQNPPPLVHCPWSGTPDFTHGTAVFGITFGNGAGNPSATGMLPSREQGIFCSYTLTGDPYQRMQELIDPAGPYRAVFQCSPIGSPYVSTYSTISAETDALLFAFDLLVCQSQGNAGAAGSRPQSLAKNILSVGGIAHQGTLTRADDTSLQGPQLLDGRVKPDLAGPSSPMTTTSTGGVYTTFSGTSAAVAVLSGASGLVFQMWHERIFRGFGGAPSVFLSRPTQSTARGLMINSAYQYDWLAGGPNASITRRAQGWGMPQLDALYTASPKTFIVNESDPLLPQQVRTYTLTVAPGEPALRATMVFLDPPGNPAAAQARINDLSLRITAPDQTAYWGNRGLTTGLWSTPGGSPDSANVVENVFIQNPAPGVWTVQVIGSEIVQDARLETPELDADFALVVSGISCYANCDSSTLAPILNVADFTCFLQRFAAADAYANCDGNTQPPVLNVADFTCFLQRFAAGCP